VNLYRSFVLVFSMLLLSGCVKIPSILPKVSLPVIGGKSTRQIPLDRIGERIASALPATRKTSYGRVTVLAAALQPSTQNRVEVVAKFRLVTFEIPEGIEGLVRYQAELRFDPRSKRLYLSNLVPQSLIFASPSLEEYVTVAARKGVPGTVASVLRSLSLAELEDVSVKEGVVESAKLEKNTLELTLR